MGLFQSLLRRHSTRFALAGAATLTAIGCFTACGASDSNDEPLLATSREPVQLAWVGWNESTTTTGVNLLKASSQSVNGKATGALRYGISNGVKYSCGVTFISHTYALTAAHCVDQADLSLSSTFTVEQYNTTNLDLNQAFGLQAQVSGDWPDYYRSRKLSAADGYVVKPYTGCKIIARCSTPTEYGHDVKCPVPPGYNLDLAMIQCPTREKNTVNYVKVATDAHVAEVKAGTRAVEVWWFHEVLNLATTANMPYEPYMPNFNWDHYGKYGAENQNYHYWHSAADTDRQLLPLISKHTATNALYKATAEETMYIMDTNIPVCHGTSGSGVFAAGVNEFMGIVAEFGTAFTGGVLCETMTAASTGNGMGYTQHNWARYFESMPEVTADR